MAEQKPKVTFDTNVPKQLFIAKMFKAGENSYGKWFGYDVTECGEEKTLFAGEALNEQLAIVMNGRQNIVVNFLYKEMKNKEGKPYHVWEVAEALFDNKGNLTPAPKESIATNDDARVVWKRDVVKVFEEMLFESAGLAERFNQNPLASDGFKLDHEDVRAIAISMVIQFQRDK
jgi:hypothetical protein